MTCDLTCHLSLVTGSRRVKNHTQQKATKKSTLFLTELECPDVSNDTWGCYDFPLRRVCESHTNPLAIYNKRNIHQLSLVIPCFTIQGLRLHRARWFVHSNLDGYGLPPSTNHFPTGTHTHIHPSFSLRHFVYRPPYPLPTPLLSSSPSPPFTPFTTRFSLLVKCFSAVVGRDHRADRSSKRFLELSSRFSLSLFFAMGVTERTFVAVKPDGVQRCLVGEIIRRCERAGYKLIGMKMVHPTQEQAQRHYKRLSGRSFFKQLVDYFTSGPVVAMSWEGVNVVSGIRRIIGGIGQGDSIREEFSMNILHNVAHTSDSV